MKNSIKKYVLVGVSLVGFCVFTIALIVSCLGVNSRPEPPGDSTIEVPRVPNLVLQFLSITGVDGYPFTFRYWTSTPCITQTATSGCFIGDDPTLKTHYQSGHRVQGPDGTAYLYLTRNGNPFTSGDDHPGEILIVRMGSRNRIGKAFEQNWPGIYYG